MNFYFYLLLKLTRSPNFNIPAPVKSSGILRLWLWLRLHNTELSIGFPNGLLPLYSGAGIDGTNFFEFGLKWARHHTLRVKTNKDVAVQLVESTPKLAKID
jgi:hypothetical protein